MRNFDEIGYSGLGCAALVCTQVAALIVFNEGVYLIYGTSVRVVLNRKEGASTYLAWDDSGSC